VGRDESGEPGRKGPDEGSMPIFGSREECQGGSSPLESWPREIEKKNAPEAGVGIDYGPKKKLCQIWIAGSDPAMPYQCPLTYDLWCKKKRGVILFGKIFGKIHPK